ncbi:uncharacterized protein ACRADG_000946 [Cochliomyia hominivorax]
MANYKILWSNENLKWPPYVSTITLGDEQLQKALIILEKALAMLEVCGAPSYKVYQLNSAKRTGLYLYEIIANLENPEGEVKECKIMILNEPWMKANSIALACFECVNDFYNEKCVLRRKKYVKYYKGDKMPTPKQKKQKIVLETDV